MRQLNIKTISLSLFLLIFSIYQSSAQQVKWGRLQTSRSQLYTPHIMGEDGDFFYSTSTEVPDIFIEKFNKSDLSRQYSQKIEHPKIGRTELMYEGIYFMNNKFVIFASYFDSKESNSNIYAYIYDAGKGIKTGEPKLVMTVPVDKLKRKGDFYVFVSKDRTKILVNHAGYYKKEKCFKDRYLLLNEQMEMITEKEDKVYKNEIDYRTFNFAIDNDGSIYYIKTMLNNQSYIVSYDANKDYEKWEEHIDLSDISRKTRVTNLHFSLNSENDLMLVGYYAEDEFDLRGTFIMKVKTSSKEIVFKKVNPFDKETLRQLVATNKIKPSPKSNPRININEYGHTEILATPDGGIVLLGETIQWYGAAAFMYDVAVFAHSPQGELLWVQKVPKHQVFAVRTTFKSLELAKKPLEYSSFLPAISNGQLMVFVNDSRDYANKSRDEITNKMMMKKTNLSHIKKTAPVYYSFDLKSGEVKKSLLLPKSNDKAYFKPLLSYQRDFGTDIVVFNQHKKNYKLGILPKN